MRVSGHGNCVVRDRNDEFVRRQPQRQRNRRGRRFADGSKINLMNPIFEASSEESSEPRFDDNGSKCSALGMADFGYLFGCRTSPVDDSEVVYVKRPRPKNVLNATRMHLYSEQREDTPTARHTEPSPRFDDGEQRNDFLAADPPAFNGDLYQPEYTVHQTSFSSSQSQDTKSESKTLLDAQDLELAMLRLEEKSLRKAREELQSEVEAFKRINQEIVESMSEVSRSEGLTPAGHSSKTTLHDNNYDKLLNVNDNGINQAMGKPMIKISRAGGLKPTDHSPKQTSHINNYQIQNNVKDKYNNQEMVKPASEVYPTKGLLSLNSSQKKTSQYNYNDKQTNIEEMMLKHQFDKIASPTGNISSYTLNYASPGRDGPPSVAPSLNWNGTTDSHTASQHWTDGVYGDRFKPTASSISVDTNSMAVDKRFNVINPVTSSTGRSRGEGNQHWSLGRPEPPEYVSKEEHKVLHEDEKVLNEIKMKRVAMEANLTRVKESINPQF